jgi:hypothetical protein
MKYHLINYNNIINQYGGVKSDDLNNQGHDNNWNKCYFNASLQLIYHIKELKDFLIKVQWQYKKDSIAWNFIELLKTMKNNDNDFKKLQNEVGKTINPKNFGEGKQADPDELITTIFGTYIHLDCTQNTLNLNINKDKTCFNDIQIKKFKKNDPRNWYMNDYIKKIYKIDAEINDDKNILSTKKEPKVNFEITFDSTEIYMEYFNIKETYKNNIVKQHQELSKLIQNMKLKNIQNYINNSNTFDTLEGDNQYKYENKYIDAKILTNYEFNKFIFIGIKSFIQIGNIKNFNELYVHKIAYHNGYINKELTIKDKKYELIGFIEHKGSANYRNVSSETSGHYICYIYNSTNNTFRLFDDPSVSDMETLNPQNNVTFVAYRLKTTTPEEYKKIYTPIATNLPIEKYFEDMKEPKNIIELICNLLE